MTPRLCLALQVWSGDVYIAQRLARLICEIEPNKREDIEFLISARKDTNKFAVRELGSIVREKFKTVEVHFGRRHGIGWPAGSNCLWADTMTHSISLHRESKLKSDGILTFEADCLPLRPDWINRLAEEWENRGNAHCVGHVHTFHAEQGPTHINGNAIFAWDFLTRYPQFLGAPDTSGWDAWHGKLLLQIGKDTDMISQLYRLGIKKGPDGTDIDDPLPRSTIEGFRKNGKVPAMWHGLKFESGIDAVEHMLGDGTFYRRALVDEPELNLI